MGRGLSRIIFIWCRGYFLNRETGRVCFEKGHKRGRVLKRIKRKGGGFGKFCPLLLPPADRSRGGGTGGLAALGKKGKTEREARGIDSRPHLARRRPEGAGPRRPAAAGRGVYGGGATRPGRRRAAVEGVAAAGECAEGVYLYAGEARGRGCAMAGGRQARGR